MRSQIWQSMSESLLELMTDDNNKLFSEEIAVPHGMKYVVMKKGNINISIIFPNTNTNTTYKPALIDITNQGGYTVADAVIMSLTVI